MALGPVSNLGAGAPPSPARDVTNAQRAFFQAALSKVEAAPAIEPPRPQLAAAPQPPAAAAPTEAPKPQYRPGSLLDITI